MSLLILNGGDRHQWLEDSDTVTIHDIESGYTNRLPVSDVFYLPARGIHCEISDRLYPDRCRDAGHGAVNRYWIKVSGTSTKEEFLNE